MKILSKKEIEAIVANTFAEFPDAKQVFVTTDGNAFIMENRARLHAGTKGLVLTYHRELSDAIESKSEDKTVETKTAPVDNKPKLQVANEVIALIGKAETAQDLAPFSADTRKSVKAAFDKRSTELQASTQQTSGQQESAEQHTDEAASQQETTTKIQEGE